MGTILLFAMSQTKIDNLIHLAVQKDASDIHLVVNKPPLFRIHGDLAMSDQPSLTSENLNSLVFSMLTDIQKETFLETRELDFSYSARKEYQSRVNLHFEKGNLAATIRILSNAVESMEKLGLPPVVKKFAAKRKGLVIVSGTAGSGKSTTLTYMVDMINRERKCKVVTIEDPIEFIHQSKQSLIIQREVGSDTRTFANALKFSLRQDPDVVVVGEMRDYESISMALTTAETGHLVLTTVHAPDVTETLNRIIDVYPVGYRDQICMQLAGNLLGVISQTLIPRNDAPGRVLATEVLTATVSVRNLIRRGVLNELRGQMDSETDPDLHTIERSLSDLVKKGFITKVTAIEYTKDPNLLDFSETTEFRKAGDITKEKEKKLTPFIEKKEQKVLIIDTNEQDKTNMAKVIKGHGYDLIYFAKEAKESIEKVKAIRPYLIILDAELNEYDMDSFKLCEQIKAVESLNTEVIMITGNLKVDTAERSKKAGADDFAIKTSAYELLSKALNNLNS